MLDNWPAARTWDLRARHVGPITENMLVGFKLPSGSHRELALDLYSLR